MNCFGNRNTPEERHAANSRIDLPTAGRRNRHKLSTALVALTLSIAGCTEEPTELGDETAPAAHSEPLTATCNGNNLSLATTIALPGRGSSVAFAPSGEQVLVSGHFKDSTTTMRYDAKVYDAITGALDKSFDCHYYWVLSTAWSENPYIGNVIATGAFDHAIKLWDADASGSTKCQAGQFKASEGGIAKLLNIDGATTAMEFSPNGKYLATANKDGAIRIWQIEPGQNQFRVVSLFWSKATGNTLSVSWSPDGTKLVTGDRKLGRVAVWSFDAATDLWSDAEVETFAGVSFTAQRTWFPNHAAELARTPLFESTGNGWVWNARFSSDGNTVIAATKSGALIGLDATTGELRYSVEAPTGPELHGLAVHPSSSLVAVGGNDHKIHFFNGESGGFIKSTSGHADTVTALAWSPDGCTLASTAGGPRISQKYHTLVSGPDTTAKIWRAQ